MKRFFLLAMLLNALGAMATNYYVSGSGSDGNNGLSPNTPFATLQHAEGFTVPGDTVFAMNGTYTNPFNGTNVLSIYNSGTANQPITYINYVGHVPTIVMYENWAGIQLQGADYIVVDGFTVIGNNDNIDLNYAISYQNDLGRPETSGNGIGIAAEYNNPTNLPHHNTIRNCNVSKCGGGGIYTSKADYTTIENNVITECAWYSPYGNSAISLYQNWNSDSSTAIKNYIVGNTCYRNEEYIPFYFVGSITDGNGIIIDDARNTQGSSTLGVYKGATYITNNVVYDNGGRGIHVYLADHVFIVNNTCYQNCQSPSVQDGEFTAYSADSCYFINNIALPSSGIPPIDRSNSSTTNLTVDHNIWGANANLANPSGTNSLTGMPGFVNASTNPTNADFHLMAGSLAINAGTRNHAPLKDKDGNLRSLTDSVDIGAYEFQMAIGLSQPLATTWNVFPNPASATISLQTVDGLNVANVICIYNHLGQLVKSENVGLRNGVIDIDIAELPIGSYFIVLWQDQLALASAKWMKVDR